MLIKVSPAVVASILNSVPGVDCGLVVVSPTTLFVSGSKVQFTYFWQPTVQIEKERKNRKRNMFISVD